MNSLLCGVNIMIRELLEFFSVACLAWEEWRAGAFFEDGKWQCPLAFLYIAF